MAGTGTLLGRQYHSAFLFHRRSLEVQPDHLPDGSFSPSIDCILSGVCACPDTKRKAKRRHCRMAVSPYPHFSPSGFASCIVADVSISLRSGASTDYGRKWYTLAFWFGLGAIFIIAFVLRTPKRLRGEGLFMIGLSLLLVAEPMMYAGNFALCGEETHYPAKVLERNIEQDDDDDSLEYSLTVQLDDGTAF